MACIASTEPAVTDRVSHNIICNEVRRTAPGCLCPLQFFVSWQGVVTLAYSGLPPSLVDLKSRIGSAIPGLKPEQPGSMWPKTSLGCLNDRKRLTPEQLATLQRICHECSAGFEGSEGYVIVDRAELVVHQCRSLERTISLISTPMGTAAQGPPWEAPSVDQLANVRRVMDEAEEHDYWIDASKDGNRRAHYDGPGLGVSLVHYLAARDESVAPPTQRIIDAIREFQVKVDLELPLMYFWFAEPALHVTLRALIA